MHGLAFWFDVELGSVLLDTSPSAPVTHWKQTSVLTPSPLPVVASQHLAFGVDLTQEDSNPRAYNLSLDIGAEPCDCAKCQVLNCFTSSHPS
jgi:hypothetical protein